MEQVCIWKPAFTSRQGIIFLFAECHPTGYAYPSKQHTTCPYCDKRIEEQILNG